MLDIHKGQSKDKAAKMLPSFQFEEGTHAKVFAGPGFEKVRFPKLSKIEDYYADASFVTEELPILIKEINEIMKRFAGDVAVTKVLQAFRSTCEEALKADEALFCFAD